MTQQTLAQSRVADPILTTHAQGYVSPGKVGQKLFPLAPVNQYGGKIITFGKEAFVRYNTRRAPGAETKTVTFGYEGDPYSITSNALDAVVPRENMNDAQQVPGIDLATDAVDVVLEILGREHEWKCAELARNASNYDTDHKVALTGQNRWLGTSGDPTDDIRTAREAIRSTIGIRPNLVLLSASAFNACETNAAILDRIKYTGRDSVTAELLAKLWNVKEVVVGEEVGAASVDSAFTDIWGDDVIVAYVSPPTGSNRRNKALPSYGYTYQIGGMPMVEKPYWHPGRRSWVYGVSDDSEPVLSGVTAGYLIQNAGAAPA
ncbi:MAG: hypothetical protein JNM58_00790 [Xanthomonadaceae bacterium]|nr:hypothetical protein [Xanthomonadaceae bacterium]